MIHLQQREIPSGQLGQRQAEEPRPLVRLAEEAADNGDGVDRGGTRRRRRRREVKAQQVDASAGRKPEVRGQGSGVRPWSINAAEVKHLRSCWWNKRVVLSTFCRFSLSLLGSLHVGGWMHKQCHTHVHYSDDYTGITIIIMSVF